MTELGLFLSKKSASKAEISRKTGISKSRISELTLNPSTQLRAWELYLIALALDVDPGEMFKEMYKDLSLKND
ncbi:MULTISPECIES: helix-turn-helix domain-containing protein [Flavobacteriaceae]|jgi:putative transcriptional regulator|uniref:XRE family transcriptional regulator n=2 Tax=Flagellimonas TaxID=444459 RepID=A0A4S8RI59_9FLAO|nr:MULTISPECIES: helix-turn-helix transcriptional regulator [Allomuricauda]MCR9263210.1 helix-turn-helix transcriptional regulator [Flavobacteriaceae bacterium]KAB7530591.1 helix-turn-helix domain-containing protein [Allomuricauda olearia]MDC6363489.1 helix-turn-helix transcriptional regulator [Muricauda sp. SP22]RYC51318.1 DNA-binding protein [Allomuricauda olearia]THV57630.1 XRE family transcriptional regulator [Allomuricauda alvinocaridis]